jgi:hypothetical protein
MWKRLCCWTAVLATVPAAAVRAQGTPGADFQVNTYTSGAAAYAHTSVAGDGSGGFLVVWTSNGQDGSATGIFGRRYDASGTPGSEFRVNTYTTGYQSTPRVAGDGTGRFVVVWASDGQDGSDAGVFGQRYDVFGASGAEFRVNDYTLGKQALPSVAMAANGGFVVAWESDGQDGHRDGVFARTYDGVGNPGPEFRVNTYTTGWQAAPAVTVNASGAIMVVWDSDHEGNGSDIFARRLVSGSPAPAEFRVNTHTPGAQGEANVAAEPSGGFAVVWTSRQIDGDGPSISVQRYGSSGSPVGGEFQANTYTTGSQDRPKVAVGADGTLVVGWDSVDESGSGVFARPFDSSGPLSDEFRLNSYTTSDQYRVALAPDANGRFVATWVSEGQDGFAEGIFGRRFHADVIFRDGFESGDLSGWSSAATDGGDLSVTGAAALKTSTAGLQGVVDDTAGLFVQDNTPNDENRYHARFYVDPNGFDPGEASGARRTRVFIVFAENPSRRLAALVLRRVNGVYAVMGRARLDDNSQADTGFFTISNAPHFVELDWRRASGPDAEDGEFELRIDGMTVSILTGLDNSLNSVDFVRLGALSVKATATGTLFWDEFESRRFSDIGP